MKPHGLTFRSDLALAIREGRKTQTRRPIAWMGYEDRTDYPDLHAAPYFTDDPEMGWTLYSRKGGACWHALTMPTICPWQVGDRAFVKEDWWHYKSEELEQAAFIGGTICLLKEGTPSLFLENKSFDPRHYAIWKRQVPRDMPSWAARTWLEITEIRRQRIREISLDDVFAEGCMLSTDKEEQRDFQNLWQSLYPGSWERNEFVWALTFKETK